MVSLKITQEDWMYGNHNNPHRNHGHSNDQGQVPYGQPPQSHGPQGHAPYGQAPHGQAGVMYGDQHAQYGDHVLYQDQRYEGDLSDPAVLAFAKKVYAYFGSALLTAAAAAFGGTLYVEHLIATDNAGAVGGLWIGSMAVFFISYLVVVFTRKAQSPLKTGLLYVFAGAAGLTLSPMLMHFVGSGMGMAIVIAFGITAVTFFGASVYVLTTNQDFRSIGGYLMVGLLVLIGLILMSFFVSFPSPLVHLMMAGGFILFVGFTLYDTSNVTRNHFYRQDAVTAAILLLFNFIMLFRYALYFLGMGRD
jgi:FtsH-binding integral membrane protein